MVGTEVAAEYAVEGLAVLMQAIIEHWKLLRGGRADHAQFGFGNLRGDRGIVDVVNGSGKADAFADLLVKIGLMGNEARGASAFDQDKTFARLIAFNRQLPVAAHQALEAVARGGKLLTAEAKTCLALFQRHVAYRLRALADGVTQAEVPLGLAAGKAQQIERFAFHRQIALPPEAAIGLLLQIDGKHCAFRMHGTCCWFDSTHRSEL